MAEQPIMPYFYCTICHKQTYGYQVCTAHKCEKCDKPSTDKSNYRFCDDHCVETTCQLCHKLLYTDGITIILPNHECQRTCIDCESQFNVQSMNNCLYCDVCINRKCMIPNCGKLVNRQFGIHQKFCYQHACKTYNCPNPSTEKTTNVLCNDHTAVITCPICYQCFYTRNDTDVIKVPQHSCVH